MHLELAAWKNLPGRRLPERPLFAIGDIHGYSDALERMLTHLAEYIPDAYPGQEVDLVFLGDLIDRGPDPLGVLELAGKGLGQSAVRETLLMGNHDWYLATAAGFTGEVMTEGEIGSWLTWGGSETLTALNVEPYEGQAAYQACFTPTQAAALTRMEWSFSTGDVFCVHAGVDPFQPLASQQWRDLIWIRDPFLAAAEGDAWPFDVTVVHGHTPSAHGMFANRIGVDSGGYATGIFTAVEMSEQGARFHHVIDE
ncbi:MAG: metallophosphoesterase [Rhodobacteraceae bacterium]|nr:metallophosphoesterase [Paracoccaceae bacterium]